jgi:flagellar biosynthesis protein FliR
VIAFATLFVFALLRYLPVMTLPGFTPLGWAPSFVRMMVLLSFTWLTVLSLPDGTALPQLSWPVGYVLVGLGELLIGMTFGLAVMLPNAALHTAGWLADMQAGLGSAALFNPGAENATESLLGHALMLAATVLFFTMDLHVQLFQGLSASTRVLPLGGLAFRPDSEAFFGMLGTSFVAGLMLVAPLMIGMLCLDIGVGYATRSMPQANVYFLVLPLKVAVALLILALTLAYAPMLIGRLYKQALDQVPAVLGAG